ncbi:MAG: DNA primase [Desulfobacterales bacterium]
MAALIPEDKISEIKNAADIVDIVSEAVLLKKAGKNYIGLCPFHTEKTPSFTVSPDKQIFHCFGCGTGGNVFSFLMKQEGLSFPEAARHLARRYGVDIPEKTLSPEQRQRISARESLLDLNRRAMDYFHQTLLNGAAGEKARSYLSKRGITRKTIDNFRLGFARDGWDHLLTYFSSKRISVAQLEKSGLILPRKNNTGYYDRFRNRIMFPIFDVNMQVVGFGGRVLDDSLPKYLNSPETPVYSKSRSLYGIHRAREACRSSGTVFIVEGYLDLLALHQHGIENSVATLGTALTAEHVRLLTRCAERMVLVYDSDEAGIRSAQRCIETFWQEHVDFRREDVFSEEKADTHILVLPAGHDPDSFIFDNGPEAFLASAANSPGIITFLLDCAIRKHGLTAEGKLRIIAELQEPLSAVNDPVARSIYIRQLAERIDIAETAVLERIRAVADKKIHSPASGLKNATPAGRSQQVGVMASAPGAAARSEVSPGMRFERRIIAMMLQFPGILPDISAHNVLEYFENNTLQSIGNMIVKFNPTSADQVSELISKIHNEQNDALIASLSMEEESWDRKGCLKLLGKFVDTRQKLRNNRLLEEQIKAAEKSNDHELLLSLLSKKQKMAERSERRKMAILSEK